MRRPGKLLTLATTASAKEVFSADLTPFSFSSSVVRSVVAGTTMAALSEKVAKPIMVLLGASLTNCLMISFATSSLDGLTSVAIMLRLVSSAIITAALLTGSGGDPIGRDAENSNNARAINCKFKGHLECDCLLCDSTSGNKFASA